MLWSISYSPCHCADTRLWSCAADEHRPHITTECDQHDRAQEAPDFPMLALDHNAHAPAPARSPTLQHSNPTPPPYVTPSIHARTALLHSRCAHDPVTSAVQYRHCS